MASLDAQIAKLDSLKLAGMISQEEYYRFKNGLLRIEKPPPIPVPEFDADGQPIDIIQPENVELEIPYCYIHYKPREWPDLVFSNTTVEGLGLYSCTALSPCQVPDTKAGTGAVTGIPPVDPIAQNAAIASVMMNYSMMGMVPQMMQQMYGLGGGGMSQGMPGAPPSIPGMPTVPGMPSNVPPSMQQQISAVLPTIAPPPVPGMPTPPGMDYNNGMGMGMGVDWSTMMGPQPIVAQQGDWICQCTEFNQSTFSHCQLCGAPLESGQLATPGTTHIPKRMQNQGMGMNMGGNMMSWQMMMMRYHPYATRMGMGMMGIGGGNGMMGMLGMVMGRVVMRDFSKSVKAQPLPPDVTEDMVKTAFEPFGAVESVALKLDGNPAYGYVNFVNQDSVALAVAGKVVQVGTARVTITNKGLGQEMLMARGGTYPREVEPSNGIGLFRLSPNCREEDIWAKVKPLGAHTVKMVIKDGGFAGYAFAYFSSVEAATAAKEELTGDLICGMPFDVKYAIKGRGPGARGRGVSRYH
eukprot:NODE_1728_length_1834_cov_67.748101_g1466_i0.p1 GENE.NODE_1728_length_1834_cov_67.748101_g1466_i0~~NODE_1728_length_1834_cov_67.748101_g1466_i0.p1  ORF type:complete len:523 (+),score=127.11 NODE_1728_length_1834_cov_67.748101_g1466_i0:173-1741(+)